MDQQPLTSSVKDSGDNGDQHKESEIFLNKTYLNSLIESDRIQPIEGNVIEGKVVSENFTTVYQYDPSEGTTKEELKKECDDDLHNIGGEFSDDDVKFIDVSQDRGVMKRVMKFGVGDETPGHGDKVYIHSIGYYRYGITTKLFYESEDTVCFHLGRGAVVKGLDYGIATMNKGEVSYFIIHPAYGYGKLGSSGIPPLATLFFKVELIDWKLEDLSPQKDEGILRKVIQKGEGLSFPNEGALVKAKIMGSYDGKVFEDRDVEFSLGEGQSTEIPESIEIALYKFKLHEKSILYLKGTYAFELEKKILEALLPDSVVEYEIHLHSFAKAKEVWEMNSDEKYENSVEAKAKGVQYFQVGNYKLALKLFKKIITYLEDEPGIAPESQNQRKVLLTAGYLNVSLCQMKMQNYIDAMKMCDKALSLDDQNEKALYRRGQCRLEVNDYEEALVDFEKCLEVNPDNKACKKLITWCCSQIKNQQKKDQNIYTNMFQKFVDQDEEEQRKRGLMTETGVWEKESISSDEEVDNLLKNFVYM